MKILKFFLYVFLVFTLTGCALKPIKKIPPSSKDDTYQTATMRPYVVHGKRYYPEVVKIGDTQSGLASWYGPNFHGKSTSNGERYNMNAMTAAHKTFPMNTMVRVTNKNSGESVIVRINDRGPFVSGRVIDLSKQAAKMVGVYTRGTAPVLLEVVGFSGNLKENSAVIGGNFMVQIGAFKRLEGAKIYKNEFNGKGGYNAIFKEFSDEMIYRVFLVGFRSESEARDFIKISNISGAFIVRE